jgi:hypothetical protein
MPSPARDHLLEVPPIITVVELHDISVPNTKDATRGTTHGDSSSMKYRTKQDS